MDRTTLPNISLDPKALRLPVTGKRLDLIEITPLLDGAVQVCASVQDNDAETWLFTRGGQFIRITGIDQDRYYLYGQGRAFEMIGDQLDDSTKARFFAPALRPTSRGPKL